MIEQAQENRDKADFRPWDKVERRQRIELLYHMSRTITDSRMPIDFATAVDAWNVNWGVESPYRDGGSRAVWPVVHDLVEGGWIRDWPPGSWYPDRYPDGPYHHLLERYGNDPIRAGDVIAGIRFYLTQAGDMAVAKELAKGELGLCLIRNGRLVDWRKAEQVAGNDRTASDEQPDPIGIRTKRLDIQSNMTDDLPPHLRLLAEIYERAGGLPRRPVNWADAGHAQGMDINDAGDAWHVLLNLRLLDEYPGGNMFEVALTPTGIEEIVKFTHSSAPKLPQESNEIEDLSFLVDLAREGRIDEALSRDIFLAYAPKTVDPISATMGRAAVRGMRDATPETEVTGTGPTAPKKPQETADTRPANDENNEATYPPEIYNIELMKEFYSGYNVATAKNIIDGLTVYESCVRDGENWTVTYLANGVNMVRETTSRYINAFKKAGLTKIRGVPLP